VFWGFVDKLVGKQVDVLHSKEELILELLETVASDILKTQIQQELLRHALGLGHYSPTVQAHLSIPLSFFPLFSL
jgi:hypothetical protein